MDYNKKCKLENCDNLFITRKRKDNPKKEKQFCSDEHRRIYSKKHGRGSSKRKGFHTLYEYTCLNCGNVFSTYTRRKKLCSEICLSEYRSRVSSKSRQFHPCKECGKETGDRKRLYCSEVCRKINREKKHTYDSDPYADFSNRRVKSFGRYVRYHRFVMEQYIGRKLLREEIVHHIDLNKHNNSIENLVILSQSQHAKLHFKNRKLDKQRKLV